jgi:hypothetical protein
VTRNRLARTAQPSPADRLAGLAVALALVCVLAIVLALAKPYALVFVLPSLYAWLWLPLEAPLVVRVGMFLLGLAGPFVGFALLANELGLSWIDAALYAVGLVTVGYVSFGTAVVALVWAAAAAQIGALAFGRYGAYAGGAAPPPPGALRRAAGRLR